jgi:hypothetical protein
MQACAAALVQLSRRGGEPVRRLVTLTFENDRLIATDGIGDSKGRDIKAIEDTKTAVAKLDDIESARDLELVMDDAIINWTLQLGAFGTRQLAEDFASKVRAEGFDAQLVEQVVPGLGTRHQVRSGLYDTFNEAQAAMRIIEKALDVVAITVPVDTPIE